MRVLFVIPNACGRYAGARLPHLGVGYLVAVAKREGIETKITDMRLNYSLSKLLDVIDEFKPDLICVTSTSFEYKKAYDLISSIKKHGNNLIAIGGPHVSAIKSRVLKETEADFAVKGEGEFTFLDLTKELRGNKNFSKVKGLIWRNRGRVVENEDRPYIEDLDNLPFPAFEEFELEKYLSFIEKRLPIATSRGCPYQCIFCSVKLSMGRGFRPRSPENVVAEMEHWYKKGWKLFEVVDDNFTLDMARAEKICKLIIQKKLDIKWLLYNGIRVDRVNENLLKLFKKAGCIFIAFGIEAGNDEVLKTIKKGITIEQVKKAVEMAKKIGFKTSGSFLVGNPKEGVSGFFDSLNLAMSLPLDNTSFYNIVPYPGTELYDWVKKNAKFLYPEETYLNSISYWENRPIFETDDFSSRKRALACKLAYSLWKKKLLQIRLGKTMGYVAWLFTKPKFIDDLAFKRLAGTKLAKMLFKTMAG